jgi:hypothetical protein
MSIMVKTLLKLQDLNMKPTATELLAFVDLYFVK